jgi:hypothetical protein
LDKLPKLLAVDQDLGLAQDVESAWMLIINAQSVHRPTIATPAPVVSRGTKMATQSSLITHSSVFPLQQDYLWSNTPAAKMVKAAQTVIMSNTTLQNTSCVKTMVMGLDLTSIIAVNLAITLTCETTSRILQPGVIPTVRGPQIQTAPD